MDFRTQEVAGRQERPVRRKGEGLRERISGRDTGFSAVGAAERELMAGDEGKPAVRLEDSLSCAGGHLAPPSLLARAPIPAACRVAWAVGTEPFPVGGQGQGRNRRPVSRTLPRDFRTRVGLELTDGCLSQAEDKFLPVSREGQGRAHEEVPPVGAVLLELCAGHLTDGENRLARRQVPQFDRV